MNVYLPYNIKALFSSAPPWCCFIDFSKIQQQKVWYLTERECPPTMQHESVCSAPPSSFFHIIDEHSNNRRCGIAPKGNVHRPCNMNICCSPPQGSPLTLRAFQQRKFKYLTETECPPTIHMKMFFCSTISCS